MAVTKDSKDIFFQHTEMQLLITTYYCIHIQIHVSRSTNYHLCGNLKTLF